MGNTATFEGYAVGLRLPVTLEAVVARLRACIDPRIKASTRFDPNQVPHITLAVGIAASQLLLANKMINEKLPMTVRVGKLMLLHAQDYDVLVKAVEADELHALNQSLVQRFNITNPYAYNPHITIGFLKKATSQSMLVIEKRISCAKEFTAVNSIVFNGKGKVMVLDA